MEERALIAVLGMALATYLPRMLPLLGLSRLSLPYFLERWLSYIPTTIFAALIFPAILMQGGKLNPGFQNYQLTASLISFLIGWRTRSMIVTVMGGLITLALLTLFLG